MAVLCHMYLSGNHTPGRGKLVGQAYFSERRHALLYHRGYLADLDCAHQLVPTCTYGPPQLVHMYVYSGIRTYPSIPDTTFYTPLFRTPHSVPLYSGHLIPYPSIPDTTFRTPLFRTPHSVPLYSGHLIPYPSILDT